MTATPLPLESRSSSGFLKPVFSALQRRALRTSIVFGAVFLVGLVAIASQIYHLLPAATRAEVLDVGGVQIALVIGFVWIGVALAATATSCPVLSEIGTSDHAPVMATFG